MELKLNEKSWHARFIDYMYPSNGLPNNLCHYFWLLVSTLIGVVAFFPVSIILRHIPLIGRGIVNAALLGFLGLIGFIYIYLPLIEGDWIPAISATIAVIVVSSFFGICYLIDKIRKNYHYVEDDRPNLVVEYYKAFKGKYCPKITWKND